eukprot:TRINITY_DN10368_c1_g1_i1.p1 TRINITY_DN10368_c1_g1~~TRINITY_DN10368_c1_g1_i1.p1  ORF type:complete len:898 (+),score=96.41 TRINITY_DN10368_c1_g1_i1:52-2694(+)
MTFLQIIELIIDGIITLLHWIGLELFQNYFGSDGENTEHPQFDILGPTTLTYSLVLVIVILVITWFGRIEKEYKKFKARKQRIRLITGEEEAQQCFQNISWVLQQAEKAVIQRCLRMQTPLLIPFLYIVYAAIHLLLAFVNQLGNIFAVLEFLVYVLRTQFQRFFFVEFICSIFQRRGQQDEIFGDQGQSQSENRAVTISSDTPMEARKQKGVKNQKKDSGNLMVQSIMEEEQLVTELSNQSSEASHVVMLEESQQWKPILSKKQRKQKKSQQKKYSPKSSKERINAGAKEHTVMVVSSEGVAMDPSFVCSPFSTQQFSLHQPTSEEIQQKQIETPVISMVRSCSDYCDVVVMARSEDVDQNITSRSSTVDIRRSYSDSSGPFLLDQIERRHVNNLMVFMFRGQHNRRQVDNPEIVAQVMQQDDDTGIIEEIKADEETLQTVASTSQQDVVEEIKLETMEQMQDSSDEDKDSPSTTSIAICTEEVSEGLVQMFQGLSTMDYSRGSGVFFNPKFLLQTQQTLSPDAHTFALPVSIIESQQRGQPIPLATLPQPLIAPPRFQTHQPQPMGQPQSQLLYQQIAPQFPTLPYQPWRSFSNIPYYFPPQYYQQIPPQPWYRMQFYPRHHQNWFGGIYPPQTFSYSPLWYSPQLQFSSRGDSINVQQIEQRIPSLIQSQSVAACATSCEIMEVEDQVGLSSRFCEDQSQQNTLSPSEDNVNNPQSSQQDASPPYDKESLVDQQPSLSAALEMLESVVQPTPEDKSYQQDQEDSTQVLSLQNPIQGGGSPQAKQEDISTATEESQLQKNQQDDVLGLNQQEVIQEDIFSSPDPPYLAQGEALPDSSSSQLMQQVTISTSQLRQQTKDEVDELEDEAYTDEERDSIMR